MHLLYEFSLFEFGKFAQSKAKARGERPVTFDFLGFTHYNSRSRDGKRYRMKRKTVSKRFTAKVVAYKEWLKANYNTPTNSDNKTKTSYSNLVTIYKKLERKNEQKKNKLQCFL